MKRFFAKLMLFGEYSVISGSDALTIPYRRYSGVLKFSQSAADKEKVKQSNTVLNAYYPYLQSLKSLHLLNFNFTRFQHDIRNGLWFDADIPPNYGLGSSGALVAAVMDEYARSIAQLKGDEMLAVLAEAESFFHGKSSGTDPLSCFVGQPLIVRRDRPVVLSANALNANLKKYRLFDTGKPAATGELVKSFLKLLKSIPESEFRTYIKSVNRAVDAIQHEDSSLLAGTMQYISEFQYTHFTEMIPAALRQIWEKGLESGEYYFKLCGSGGGGFFLVYFPSDFAAQGLFSGSRLIPIVNG